MTSRWLRSALLLSLSACDVPAPPASSGGVPELAHAGPGPCGRGFSVIESDYQSVNVALLSLDGAVLTESLTKSRVVSSGADVSLSGDVVLPTSGATGPRLALLDRAPSASRVIWIDLASGEAATTAEVGTGFPSNPHDFVALSDRKGYVARFGHNRDAGQEPFDGGSDLLVVDPRSGELRGSIDLRDALGGASASNLPRPDKVVLARGFVYALLGTLPLRGFTATVPSRLVRVDPESDTIRDVLVLEGLRGCTGMALAPAEDELAIFCSALSDSNGNSQTEYSGVALVHLSPEPRLGRVFRAETWGDAPIGSSGAYASDRRLLVTTFGRFSNRGVAEADDTLVALDLETGRVERWLSSDGVPFTLGGVACAPRCGRCVAADAARDGGVVHHYQLDERGSIASHAAVKVETKFGLPPRDVGRF